MPTPLEDPPAIVRQIEVADRESVRQHMRAISRSSISLAWALGLIRSERKFRRWGFENFNEYVLSDISNPADSSRNIMSRSYAYSLSSVGIVFYRFREKIEEMVLMNQVGMRRLVELAAKCEQGMNVWDAMRFLTHGTPLPDPFGNLMEETDPEKPYRANVFVRRGDVPNYNLVLTLHAIYSGFSSPNEAINDMILSNLIEYESIFDNQTFQKYHRFKEMIWSGQFMCKLCKKIPLEPTLHHLYPQSLYHGKGPVVLLCWSPCHKDIVQPRHELYAKKWLGADSYNDLKSQMDRGDSVTDNIIVA